MALIKVFKLRTAHETADGNFCPDSNSLILREQEAECVIDEIKSAGIGNQYILEIIEMDEVEVLNLPEFDGF